MGPKSQYTIIEQSNTLLKESLHIICPAWAPHTLLAALISIALLSSLILSLSSLASLLTSLAIILPRVMCANDECFVHRISGVSFTFRAQRDARTYTSTTDQCGARSGSPQLIICSQCNSSMKIQVHVATNVSRINCKCCIYHKLDRQYSPCNLRASSKL